MKLQIGTASVTGAITSHRCACRLNGGLAVMDPAITCSFSYTILTVTGSRSQLSWKRSLQIDRSAPGLTRNVLLIAGAVHLCAADNSLRARRVSPARRPD